MLSAAGETVNLTELTRIDSPDGSPASVINAGTLTGSGITIASSSRLTNEATGSIANALTSSGELVNEGTITGPLTANAGSVVTNRGSLSGGILRVNTGGTLTNE
ncbi:hypothetical protein SAMN05428958_1302, partial [Pantoea sesami]